MITLADFSKLFAAPFAGSKVAVEDLIGLQQRNFSAVVAANAKLAECAQAIFSRQAEIVQATLAEGVETARRSMTGQPVDVEKQLGLMRQTAETSMATARELAEIAGQGGTAAFEILRQRANESVAELGALFKTAA